MNDKPASGGAGSAKALWDRLRIFKQRRRRKAVRWRIGGRLLPTLRDGAVFTLANFYTVLVKLPWVFAIVIIGVILFRGLTQYVTIIEPISVPKTLADRGYTPEVAGRRLRDAMDRFVANANTRMNRPNVALHGELPNIVVPTVGISLDAIVSSLRTLLSITRSRSIAGEFTIDHDRLWLRLRLDNREFYSSKEGGDPERPDELFNAAVVDVLKIVRPYLVAAELSYRNPDAAFAMTQEIIKQRPESDENVAWSYVLQSVILQERKDCAASIDAAKKALELNPQLGAAHTNLGNCFQNERDYDNAIAAYHRAIKLDPKDPFPRNNLGNALYAKGQLDAAIAEYRAAIKLEPKDAFPHNGLGVALQDKSQLDEAIEAYREAIKLDPKFDAPHYNLARLLEGMGKLEDAAAEYEAALKLAPNDVMTRVRLEELSRKLANRD